jgi:hypothetical protein
MITVTSSANSVKWTKRKPGKRQSGMQQHSAREVTGGVILDERLIRMKAAVQDGADWMNPILEEARDGAEYEAARNSHPVELESAVMTLRNMIGSAMVLPDVDGHLDRAVGVAITVGMWLMKEVLDDAGMAPPVVTLESFSEGLYTEKEALGDG